MYKLSDRIVTFLPPESIEPSALQQIKNTASVSFLFRHVAVMPDAHYGRGSTVGTVLATRGAVIPAAVGVDIGCGMIAVRTTLHRRNLDGKLPELRKGIEHRIPMSAGKFNRKVTATAQPRVQRLQTTAGIDSANRLSPNWREQLGTLGGGNHFIEICLDTEDTVWVTLHSGSRGVGNRIGTHYIARAQKQMERQKITLPDRDLAYLSEETPEFNEYIRDLNWAQAFALANREEMLDRVMMELSSTQFGDPSRGADLEKSRINCHHNFTQMENHFGETAWITRKGAIRASDGLMGMIPGSMGTRSYIVSGLGNKMAFESAPHGAGRRMSRGQAKRSFTMADFDRAMEGIEHRRSAVLIDELPQAYKDIDAVMKNARELVTIEATLKQILNVKGD